MSSSSILLVAIPFNATHFFISSSTTTTSSSSSSSFFFPSYSPLIRDFPLIPLILVILLLALLLYFWRGRMGSSLLSDCRFMDRSIGRSLYHHHDWVLVYMVPTKRKRRRRILPELLCNVALFWSPSDFISHSISHQQSAKWTVHRIQSSGSVPVHQTMTHERYRRQLPTQRWLDLNQWFSKAMINFFFFFFPIFYFLSPILLIVWFSSDASPCQDSAALLQQSLIGNEEVNGQRSESNPPQMEKKGAPFKKQKQNMKSC